jgi:hypothetical protein
LVIRRRINGARRAQRSRKESAMRKVIRDMIEGAAVALFILALFVLAI